MMQGQAPIEIRPIFHNSVAYLHVISWRVISRLVIAPEASNLSSLQIIDKPFDTSFECAFLASGHIRIVLCKDIE